MLLEELKLFLHSTKRLKRLIKEKKKKIQKTSININILMTLLTFGSPWATSLVLVTSNGKLPTVATRPAREPHVKFSIGLVTSFMDSSGNRFLARSANISNARN